ncbi:hypothetical protein KIH74_15290 [Kineosporia sp. J2-2]|uniref:Tetracycline repressor TetR C-terminal domain-containing protein n=1 Tax=Kineosporia corallincola TaxID=2835133 RepID=A0ABS5TGY8_9ACTN|nr:hypothetical protein [Kineosporia corallincola]MBT0770305.1 hypothetical protein [Kineosporia corallincola]
MWFLVESGMPEQDAQMAMLAASRFTVGSVLEEQADAVMDEDAPDVPGFDQSSAFEAGLAMIIDGLALRQRPA